MTIERIYTKSNQRLAELKALPLEEHEGGDHGFCYQSPIDFADVPEVIKDDSLNLEFFYSKETYTQEIFGGSYHLVPTETKSYVKLENVIFKLVDIHVHFPSEHLFDDQAHKFEFHLVHENAEGVNLVIGLVYDSVADEYLIESPERRRLMLELFREGEDMHFTPGEFLPESLTYYHFIGSLTTPPYSGPVLWFIMDELQHGNHDIMKRVKRHVPINNSRVVFDIKDRIMYHN